MSELYDVNIVITIAASALAVALAAMARHGGSVAQRECFLIRHGTRVTLVALALALLSSLLYSIRMGWSPWPGDVALRCAIALYLLVGILAPYVSPRMRARRERDSSRGWS